MSKKIALVLSGGGARGLAHIGVIEELEKRGYEITSIAGTSMGALVGGVYACGKLDEYKKWVCGLSRHEMFMLVDFTFGGGGIIKGEKVLNAMKEFMPDRDIADLTIPYSATAVDIIKHEEVVYRTGSLYYAIRASIAIPSVFTPVIQGDSVIVDGGVLNNVPISNVERNEGDLLVAVNVNADISPKKTKESKNEIQKKEKAYLKWLNDFSEFVRSYYPKEKKESLGFLSLIDKTIATGMLKLAQYAIKDGNPDVLINVSREACGTYDFYKANELIEMGRETVIETLDKI
ncbi:patatin-like phospholipase family protein [Prolixibacteraceae bacterium Z1-6]|uniref:Patatin-like phospholipase family protein n=1 Tax=Draconibacterium aestuarii TaxID=2998507 RepID=A0A9X3F309_9BACT|nr:patatin-like phospholipase family protein [Prolixibacteraceae bacterium Z1-6]